MKKCILTIIRDWPILTKAILGATYSLAVYLFFQLIMWLVPTFGSDPDRVALMGAIWVGTTYARMCYEIIEPTAVRGLGGVK